MNHSPEQILAVALSSDPNMPGEVGLTRTRIVQQALMLAHDPDVALAHPVLVGRVADFHSPLETSRVNPRMHR